MAVLGSDFSSSRATVRLVTHCSIAAAQVLSPGSVEARKAVAMCAHAAPASRRLDVAFDPLLRSGRGLRSLPSSAAFLRQRLG